MMCAMRCLFLAVFFVAGTPLLLAQWTEEFEVLRPTQLPSEDALAIEVVGLGANHDLWRWWSPHAVAYRFTRCVIDDKVIEQLARLPKVKELHLNECTGVAEAALLKTVWDLAGKLKLLRIQGEVTDFSTAQVFAGKAEVERFQYFSSRWGASYEQLMPQDVAGCLGLSHLKELGVAYVVLPDIERVKAAFGTKIEAISFFECEGLSDAWLARLEDCKGLRSVSIGFRSPDRMRAKYPDLTAAGIAKHCLPDAMESLTLHGVNCKSQAALLSRVSELKHLRYLHLRCLTDADLTPILAIAGGLVVLDLMETVVAPELLAELLRALGANCEQLWLEDPKGAESLSHETAATAIEEFLRRASGLMTLALRATAPMPYSLFRAIAARKQIKALYVKGLPVGMNEATDAATALLGMPNLRTLALFDCENLADRALAAKPAEGLRELSLANGQNLSDEALAGFLLRCGRVNRISIADCPLAGDHTAAALQALSGLVFVSLRGTAIRNEALQKVKAGRPWLAIVEP